MPHKKTPFYKHKKFIVLIAVLLIAVISSFAYFGGEPKITYDSVTATKGELIQEVSVTGRVEPSESVNLSFEISGKVAEIYAGVGDRVEAGAKLISLNSGDLSAQLRQAQAGAASAQAMIQQYEAAVKTQEARLEELKKGARPEEIQLSETAVTNAEKVLEDAKKNLENITIKTEVDLEQAYSNALTALFQAVNTGKTVLITFTEIQLANFGSNTQDGHTIGRAKASAVLTLLGGQNADFWVSQVISIQTGGVYGDVQSLMMTPTNEGVDTAIISTLDALQKIQYTLNLVPISDKLSAAEKTSLDTIKANTNAEITNISSKQQAIAVQGAANENSILTAESAINTAQSSLATTKDQLGLKLAGATREQIQAQEAQVSQAKASLASQKAMLNQAYANVQNSQAQLAKTVLHAPITGLITKMEAKVGEVVFPSSPYSDSRITFVSIISDQNYEIEVNVSEVDIAKIKSGNAAMITLDAYGDETEFNATVTSIEPAETIIEGISTYKVKLQFNEQDERIKSGMTANIDILTAKKENVITIPQRAIITKDGQKIVRVIEEKEKLININETIIVTGLRGSNGRMEILEGINEGDEVVISIKEE